MFEKITPQNYLATCRNILFGYSEYVICDINFDTLSYTNKINSRETITGRPSDEELTRALIGFK